MRMKQKLIIFFGLIIFSCIDHANKKGDFKSKSISTVGIMEFKICYSALLDTFNIWIINNLREVESELIYPYKIDSLLCFNKEKNRLITCRHLYVNVRSASSDDLQFVYGEKINAQWYFFKGASIVVPRSMIKGQDIHKPISYQQLHQIALKEVYSGYLNSNGEINEEWFTGHFENAGWCSKCKTKEDFQKSRLQDVKTLWLQRNTSQPIKQLQVKNEKLP
jgi:hypothetical protein